MMNENQEIAQQRSRRSLIFLLLIFILPVVIAYVIHKNPQWQPQATSNYGVLIKPSIRLNSFTATTRDGKPFTLEQLRGKWSLIYIGNGECAQKCQETLLKARNGRVAQGAEGTRIKYYYILNNAEFIDDRQIAPDVHPSLVVLKTNATQSHELVSQFQVESGQQVGHDDRLYLVTPPGEVIMYYPSGFKDLGLMEDLKHLLKWSQVG